MTCNGLAPFEVRRTLGFLRASALAVPGGVAAAAVVLEVDAVVALAPPFGQEPILERLGDYSGDNCRACAGTSTGTPSHEYAGRQVGRAQNPRSEWRLAVYGKEKVYGSIP